MKIFKNIFITIFILELCSLKVFAQKSWVNDLTTLFTSNNAIIYAINIRTFNAKDKNGDGIIDEKADEEKGNFLNSIDRLDELVTYGINTINLLPVTTTGKIKALGTAGSLYAPLSFNEINPQLKSSDKKFTPYSEMKKFVSECHKRQIRVIVDLPSCAAYDLYLIRPELFQVDKNKEPVTPSDWNDVRLLNAGTEAQINPDVYNLYAEFIDLMIDLQVDGIRANAASIKPFIFWKKLITETKFRNPEFLFLAEVSSESSAISDNIPFTSYKKLLDAGFDGYYGGYANLKNWKNSKNLISHIKTQMEVAKQFNFKKNIIGDFATHDKNSPILIKGPQYSKMIIWLNSTLPINSYYVDGFQTGDNYIYQWGNKKALKTFTDDDYYFVHRGQLDIFNFSRKPGSNNYDILKDFIIANKFKIIAREIISKGNFVHLKTSSPEVFAYARSYKKNSIIVIGNLNFEKFQDITVKIPKLNKDLTSVPIKISSIPNIQKGKIKTKLEPGEIQVIYLNAFELK
jgi:glycosidase